MFTNIFKKRIVRRTVKIRLRRQTLKGRKSDYLAHKEKARTIATERLEYFNNHPDFKYGFKYGRISIKNVKTRWGSCSKKGNLNFSYKIALLPTHLADYIIVHELCHLGEFNHSKNFWKLVERAVPEWKKARKELVFKSS